MNKLELVAAVAQGIADTAICSLKVFSRAVCVGHACRVAGHCHVVVDILLRFGWVCGIVLRI